MHTRYLIKRSHPVHIPVFEVAKYSAHMLLIYLNAITKALSQQTSVKKNPSNLSTSPHPIRTRSLHKNNATQCFTGIYILSTPKHSKTVRASSLRSANGMLLGGIGTSKISETFSQPHPSSGALVDRARLSRHLHRLPSLVVQASKFFTHDRYPRSQNLNSSQIRLRRYIFGRREESPHTSDSPQTSNKPTVILTRARCPHAAAVEHVK